MFPFLVSPLSKCLAFWFFPRFKYPNILNTRAQVPVDVGENTDPTLVRSTTWLLYNVLVFSVRCDVLKNRGIEL